MFFWLSFQQFMGENANTIGVLLHFYLFHLDSIPRWFSLTKPGDFASIYVYEYKKSVDVLYTNLHFMTDLHEMRQMF